MLKHKETNKYTEIPHKLPTYSLTLKAHKTPQSVRGVASVSGTIIAALGRLLSSAQQLCMSTIDELWRKIAELCKITCDDMEQKLREMTTLVFEYMRGNEILTELKEFTDRRNFKRASGQQFKTIKIIYEPSDSKGITAIASANWFEHDSGYPIKNG
eukprot:10606-Heterococcus_DN1.PRE.1